MPITYFPEECGRRRGSEMHVKTHHTVTFLMPSFLPHRPIYPMEIPILLITQIPKVQRVLDLLASEKLDQLCSQPHISDIIQALQARIKKLELPLIREEWAELKRELLSPSATPDAASRLLLWLGKVCVRTQLCHDLLSLPSTSKDHRECDRSARRLSVQLHIPGESKYVETKFKRWANESHNLQDLLRPGLSEDVTKLVGLYLQQLMPTYIHAYPKFPTSVYKICREITAKGSFGSVTKVESRLTRRHFAMKTFRDIYFPKKWETLRDEMVILQVCCHPNLLRIVDAFKTGDTALHFVTEPWAPYTLFQFLYSPDNEREKRCRWFKPNDPDSTAIIFRLMYGLADGLQFLHTISIKHKDIKPSNILLYLETDPRKIKPILADVGKSKVWYEGATTRHTDSTRMFLAPEQVCKKQSTLQADIWQLGCCFASLLAFACGGDNAAHSLRNTCLDPPSQTHGCFGIDREHFLVELDKICGSTQRVSKALEIVKSMLVEEPESRSDIHEIFARLGRLV
ncbi:kinase-like domain-containing protein [Xylaria telfairii]|nr:kinase-like domain-containing protein [Xylaria telfairii]